MAKRKAAESEAASSDADHHHQAPPSPPSAKHKSKKKKIDWATIDDDGFDGFTVKSVSLRAAKPPAKGANKKQKTAPSVHGPTGAYKNASLDAQLTQKNPFEEADLSEVHCKIEPAAEWESTRRYRKFTINGEEFEFGQVVFVKKTDEAHDTPDAIPQWFAKVLEVRGGDPSHVYLRVFWAYRPEDLPGGRQPHHGESELIVSNHMDIIEALTVESVADVVHWDDNLEKSELPAKHQLFWRQSFDINKPRGKQLSKLPTHCIDKTPCNPDELLVNCVSCKQWLHARCLEQQAVEEESKRTETSPSTSAKAKTPKKASRTTVDEPSRPFKAKLHLSSTGKTCLTLTDMRKGEKNRKWDVNVKCLLCHEIIETADNSELQDTIPETPLINGNNTGETQSSVIPPDSVVPPADKSEQALDTEEKDSVIGNDAPPTTNGIAKSNAEAEEARTVRGRGRPPRRAEDMMPSRPRKSIAIADLIEHTEVTTPTTTKTTNTNTPSSSPHVVETKSLTTTTTPLGKSTTPDPERQTPPGDSVFTTGLNSVKKLIWPSST